MTTRNDATPARVEYVAVSDDHQWAWSPDLTDALGRACTRRSKKVVAYCVPADKWSVSNLNGSVSWEDAPAPLNVEWGTLPHLDTPEMIDRVSDLLEHAADLLSTATKTVRMAKLADKLREIGQDLTLDDVRSW